MGDIAVYGPPEIEAMATPAGDIPAGEAETDTILERFKADKVKTILAVGGSITLVARSMSSKGEPLTLSTLT